MAGLTIGDAPVEPKAVVPENFIATASGGVAVDPSKETPAAPEKPTTPPAGERPASLPEKFKSVEDLAKAYGELEAKLGAPKTPETPKSDTPFDFTSVAQEFATNNGSLSAETLAALTAKGLSADVVSTFIEGQKAIHAQVRSDFAAVAGGEEQLQAVMEWAKTGLAPTEIQAYNAALTAGNAELGKMLFETINARFVAANGKEPSLLTGRTVPNASGEQPFESWAQVTVAMSDPKYKSDPAYNKKVASRLAVSNL